MHYDPEEKLAGHLGIRFVKKTRQAWNQNKLCETSVSLVVWDWVKS